MSEMLLETKFPLESHPKSTFIKECVRRCIRPENANPMAQDWEDNAHFFLRVDHASLREDLERGGIELSPPQSAFLYEFADQYADLREDESTRIEGDDNE